MSEAIVSLGSNMEPRAEYLSRALEAIASFPGTSIVAASTVIETDAVDVPEEFAEMKFLNQVAIAETSLDVRSFFRLLQETEISLGRVRTVRNGPRTIDLDLVDFDGIVLDDPCLTLPHPRAKERDFVQAPLREIRSRRGENG